MESAGVASGTRPVRCAVLVVMGQLSSRVEVNVSEEPKPQCGQLEEKLIHQCIRILLQTIADRFAKLNNWNFELLIVLFIERDPQNYSLDIRRYSVRWSTMQNQCVGMFFTLFTQANDKKFIFLQNAIQTI